MFLFVSGHLFFDFLRKYDLASLTDKEGLSLNAMGLSILMITAIEVFPDGKEVKLTTVRKTIVINGTMLCRGIFFKYLDNELSLTVTGLKVSHTEFTEWKKAFKHLHPFRAWSACQCSPAKEMGAPTGAD